MSRERKEQLAAGCRKLAGEVFFRIFGKGVEIKGLGNLPEPPYIVAFAPHMGLIEPLAPFFFLPQQPSYIAKAEIFDMPVIGWLAEKLLFFPVRRGELDMQAIRQAQQILAQGGILAIAPEGTRGRDEKRARLKAPKRGVILFAIRAQVPIVLFAIWGTEGILPLIEERKAPLKERLMFRRQKVHIKIGQPFREHLDLLDQEGIIKVTREQMEVLAHNLMLRFRDLVPEEYHGDYAGLSRREILSPESRVKLADAENVTRL